jgi:hypothetical protein
MDFTPKKKIELNNVNLYVSSLSIQSAKQVSGIFYILDGKESNNRFKITDSLDKIQNNDPRACLGYIHKTMIK